MPLENSPRLDHDTENVPGTPAISETILQKIRHSAMLIADVTFCSEIRDESNSKPKKRYPNPNVMMEVGYAAAILGWDRIVLVMNKKYGSPESLPFDLRNHRFPITFDLGPESDKGVETMSSLVYDLEMAIRACLMAQYDLVDLTLAKLSSYSRRMMVESGPPHIFWEKDNDNKTASRMDLAIAQMLELNVISCVKYLPADGGVAYSWTHLGMQCCKRLGNSYIDSLVFSTVKEQNTQRFYEVNLTFASDSYSNSAEVSGSVARPIPDAECSMTPDER